MNARSIVAPDRSTLPFFSRTLVRASIMWALATLFYFYDNLLQVSPSAMKPELSLAFDITAKQFGSLSAYCLIAYGIMQIPAGLLMDRFGARRILTLAAAFCGGGALLFGIATSLWVAKFGRAMIGVGAAFALLGCLKIATSWFPNNRFALITGLTVMVGYLGAVFGLSSISEVIQLAGWRQSMQWGGFLGLFLAVIMWIFIQDKKTQNESIHDGFEQNSVQHKAPENLREVCLGLWHVVLNKQTWIAAVYAGLMFVPTLGFGGLWGIPFLVEAHGFDRTTAGICISLIYLGWVIGAPLWGFASDYLQRRNLLMKFSTILTLMVCIVVIYCQNLPFNLLSSLLFLLGFFSSGFILAFAVVRESNPSYIACTAIGFTNCLNTLWGALAQPAIGMILDYSSSKLPVLEREGERVFSLAQYQEAFLLLPIALIISLVLLFFLKETFSKTA